jgi:uncharacterized protein YegP (UPF0339 family)
MINGPGAGALENCVEYPTFHLFKCGVFASLRTGFNHPKDIRMAHKFEIYKDKKGEYRVRFKYNSEVMFASEGYSSKSSATNAIESFKKNGPGAPVEDNS